MANVFCHVRGEKLFRLYPPSALPQLSFPHGASSSTIPDIFALQPPDASIAPSTPSPSSTSPTASSPSTSHSTSSTSSFTTSTSPTSSYTSTSTTSTSTTSSAAAALPQPLDIHLTPGDMLYIPPLWPHAAKPLTPCIAVNVFWRSLESSAYAAGKDVYGNRDLAPYENGRRAVGRIKREFVDLPREERRFYLRRLAEELVEE